MEHNLASMCSFQEAYPDIPMYMMLVPNAANVLSDKLPSFAVTRDQDKDFAEIQKALKGHLTWVDVSSAMKDHKSENIYYHTDHHWTSLGRNMDMRRLLRRSSWIPPRKWNLSLTQSAIPSMAPCLRPAAMRPAMRNPCMYIFPRKREPAGGCSKLCRGAGEEGNSL